MEKTFDYKLFEYSCNQKWLDKKLFHADVAADKDPFTIMMPPPNVTGSLHVGHALNGTLQDVLCRYNRAKGKDVLWQPGKDHASIAVHMVLEKRLAKKDQSRFDLGREKFLEHAWHWKEQSWDKISNQFKRLGASADWDRERFTMDEGLSRAVRKAFVKMYEDDLIYRDKRLVNWDIERRTAISDIEIKNAEIEGQLWYFDYPLTSGEGVITVATTRPETMLGDTGVIVHPDDERYQNLIGQTVTLPIVNRAIPIVADDYADPDTGSGAVKITPAHDFNDFEIGRRHNFDMISIFDSYARLNKNAPSKWQGLSREEVRKVVLARMEELGLLRKTEKRMMQIPKGERSGVVIEPYLTDQWYVDAKKLAGPAIEAVKEGRTVFHPDGWQNTYYKWLENIQPWCISRQLWWGHQIPVWYGEDGEIFCAEDEDKAHEKARAHYGHDDVQLTQETDILDTWFSSSLWSFSTLGWPDQTAELAKYYPTDVLVTGFDIIFPWVARMMMMSLYFMDEVPFRDVYMTPLVRDAEGQKMSKSKGNIIDPLELIDKYGCDALRFTLTTMSVQGRDINLSEQRIEGYRNFITKLWNAARFIEMNECVQSAHPEKPEPKHLINRWVLDKFAHTLDNVNNAYAQYRFNDIGEEIYHFIWDDFCDWYIELAKICLKSSNTELKQETQATIAYILKQSLVMLQPVCPFVTEAIYQELFAQNNAQEPMLAEHAWPDLKYEDVKLSDPDTETMAWLIDGIRSIRNVRASLNIPAGQKLPVFITSAYQKAEQWTQEYSDFIKTLARLSNIQFHKNANNELKGMAQAVWSDTTAFVDVADQIDVEQEMQRLEDQIKKVVADIDKSDKKLANENFIARAPQNVILKEKNKLAEAQAIKERLEDSIATLRQLG